MILNVDFALKLSNFTLFKRFIGLKWILNFSTILSQFNYHTLPVTPFKKISFLQKEKIIYVMSIERPLCLCRDTRTYVHSPFRDQNIN